MTLCVRAKVLLQLRSFSFYDTMLGTEEQQNL